MGVLVRLYHLMAQLFPGSFSAKITALACVGILLPTAAACILLLRDGSWIPPAAIALVGLGTASITARALRAALSPVGIILEAADSWIAHKSIDPLPDGYDDDVGRIMRRINQMAAEANRQRASHRRQVDTDPLTGLLNRRGFSRQMRGTEAGALLLLDLDHFKAVNDCYGHQVGDRVLCHVADTATEMLRKKDLLARWGGEEFVIFLPGAPPALAGAIANRLREAIAIDQAEVGPEVTISIGVAPHSGGEAFDQAFVAADRALYQAKSDGRTLVRHDKPAQAA